MSPFASAAPLRIVFAITVGVLIALLEANLVGAAEPVVGARVPVRVADEVDQLDSACSRCR